MQEVLSAIYGGGDDAVEAAVEMAGLAKQKRAYDDVMNAKEDITDIVTILRGIQFSCLSPSADESTAMLHYCVGHAADEIERLRGRWIPVSERLPPAPESEWEDSVAVLAWSKNNGRAIAHYVFGKDYGNRWSWECIEPPTHWMPLPAPPSDDK